MREDNWNDILREKFGDFEMELPENDWDVMETRLNKRVPLVPKVVSRRKLWRRIAAAACLICISAIPLLWNVVSPDDEFMAKRGSYEPRIIQRQTDSVARDSFEETESLSHSALSGEILIAESLASQYRVKDVFEEEKAQESVYKTEERQDNNFIKEQKSDVTENGVDDDHDTKSYALTEDDARRLMDERNKAIENRINSGNESDNRRQVNIPDKLRLGLLASISPRTSNSSGELDQYILGGASGGAAVAKAENIGKRREHHYMPVSFGIDVSFEVVKNLDIRTGITYTGLYSSFTTELNNGQSERVDNQQLHYLGVPLALSYRFWNGKILNTYASVGGMGEKGLVNVSSSKLYVDGIERIVSDESTKNPISGMQWSLNANLGLDVRLYRMLSLYLEPGFTWYIPNNKNPQPVSIRTDNPYNFTLKAGLRIKI